MSHRKACSTIKKPVTRPWVIACLFAFVLLWLWMSADGRMHWDEPGYLYFGTYQNYHQILSGDVQATGELDFSAGRILHLLIIRSVMLIAGNGPITYALLSILNTAMLCGSLYLVLKMTHLFLPKTDEYRFAALLLAGSSIVMYLAFKTLPDTAALTAAIVATYSLVRARHGGEKIWFAIAATCLSLASLIKAQAAFLVLGYWVAGCLVPVAGMDRRRHCFQGVAAGMSGILLTFGFLHFSGLGIQRFINSYMAALDSGLPVTAKLFNIFTELNVLWILLAVSFLSHRRRELAFMWIWFIVSTAPFLLITNIEARHLSTNLVAVGGLFALALEALSRRNRAWQRCSDWRRLGLSVLGVILVMSCSWLTLFTMPHEVDMRQMNRMLSSLDQRYGAGKYSILTTTGYTDFHLLRVLWPRVDTYNVNLSAFAVNTVSADRQQALYAYHRGKCYSHLDELPLDGKPLVLVCYLYTFGAENLKAALQFISPELEHWVMGGVPLVNHLYTEGSKWLWDSPYIKMVPINRVGHYLAFEIVHVQSKKFIRSHG
jgi:hypothetical protein